VKIRTRDIESSQGRLWCDTGFSIFGDPEHNFEDVPVIKNVT
jgi:hypothetical protein